mmetsp:Transcript_1751/g.2855  ORF Transcript_1751/g.2855 Transcript_1751/m.2855 type:complete len:213 (-) Transcript_1751:1-639(-)
MEIVRVLYAGLRPFVLRMVGGNVVKLKDAQVVLKEKTDQCFVNVMEEGVGVRLKLVLVLLGGGQCIVSLTVVVDVVVSLGVLRLLLVQHCFVFLMVEANVVNSQLGATKAHKAQQVFAGFMVEEKDASSRVVYEVQLGHPNFVFVTEVERGVNMELVVKVPRERHYIVKHMAEGDDATLMAVPNLHRVVPVFVSCTAVGSFATSQAVINLPA